MTFRKRQETTRPFDRTRKTTCGNCPTGCGLKAFTEAGKLVDILGDEEHPLNKGSVCPKGMLTCLHLGNPNRLTMPRIREDVSSAFRSVEWNEAIAFTARRIRELTEADGKDSLFVYGNETDPFDYLAGGTWFARGFGTRNTPGRFFPRPFGSDGAIRKMFGIPASQMQSNTPRDWCNSRCILVYCSDPAASDPMIFGPILDARDRGATLLVIDSRKTVTSSKATFSVRVKPGSQSILLKGILHLLIRNGWVDREFISEWTEDFDRLRAETEACSPERVAKTCWIDVREIETLAFHLGKVWPVQVIAGDWSTRRHLADADLFGCAAIACVRGSIGIPGGGVNLLGVSPFLFDDGSYGGTEHEDARPMAECPGHIDIERVLAHPDSRPSCLIWRGNPYPVLAGGEAVRAGLERVPLVVHLSAYPNETFQHAHVSIPASHWMEYTGLLTVSNTRAVQCHRKVMDPPGDCRPPIEFWIDLACALDLPEAGVLKDANAREDRAGVYDEFLRKNPLTGSMSFADLDPNTQISGGVLWPCTCPSHLELESTRFVKGTVRGLNILFQRNEKFPLSDTRFPTPSGKILLGLVPKEDAFAAESGADADACPLILTTGFLVDYVEQFGYFVSDRNPALEPSVKIHPKLAKVIGVKTGDKVTVENARGSFSAPAWVCDDVDPRVIWCPEGADRCQPVMNWGNPKLLFDVPSSGRVSNPFTMVTVFRSDSSRDHARVGIARLMKELG